MEFLYKSVLLIASITLSACGAIGPLAVVDYSDLGESKLAKAIALELSHDTIPQMKRAIRKLTDDINPLQANMAREAYTSIGFNCEASPSTKCRFVGSAKFELRNVSAELSALNAHTQRVEILLDYSSKPITLDIQVVRTKN